MSKRRLQHNQRIISQKRVSISGLKPGMIAKFTYKSNTIKNIFDKNPLILFLYRDNRFNLIHSINLNYLYENDVQNLFEHISKKIPIKLGNKLDGRSTYLEFTKEIKPKQLYESIIKPKLLNMKRTSDCYRTYKINKMSTIRLVNYKLDIIEKQIRKQTGLSKHELKTSDLYESVEQQKLKIETDNVRVEKQEEIIKDIRK